MKVLVTEDFTKYSEKHLDNILNSITPEQRKALNQAKVKYEPMEGDKYIRSMRKYMNEKLKFYYYMRIPEGKKLRILDIGTGIGFLPYICSYFGHEVKAVDLGSNELLNAAVKILNVDRLSHRIEAFEPIPSLGMKFDFITATRICFNNHNLPNIWYNDEWEYFINHLKEQHLAENGMIRLFLNKDKIYGSISGSKVLTDNFNEELHRYFAGPIVDIK